MEDGESDRARGMQEMKGRGREEVGGGHLFSSEKTCHCWTVVAATVLVKDKTDNFNRHLSNLQGMSEWDYEDFFARGSLQRFPHHAEKMWKSVKYTDSLPSHLRIEVEQSL